jgi:hypothetical protein
LDVLGAAYLTFEHIEIGTTRGNGVSFDAAGTVASDSSAGVGYPHDITLRNCTVRNVGKHGVVLSGRVKYIA